MTSHTGLSFLTTLLCCGPTGLSSPAISQSLIHLLHPETSPCGAFTILHGFLGHGAFGVDFLRAREN